MNSKINMIMAVSLDSVGWQVFGSQPARETFYGWRAGGAGARACRKHVSRGRFELNVAGRRFLLSCIDHEIHLICISLLKASGAGLGKRGSEKHKQVFLEASH